MMLQAVRGVLSDGKICEVGPLAAIVYKDGQLVARTKRIACILSGLCNCTAFYSAGTIMMEIKVHLMDFSQDFHKALCVLLKQETF